MTCSHALLGMFAPHDTRSVKHRRSASAQHSRTACRDRQASAATLLRSKCSAAHVTLSRLRESA
eukprot:5709589-Amphidinium_carterae.2